MNHLSSRHGSARVSSDIADTAKKLVSISVHEFYLQPRKIDASALDREAAALVEGRK